MGRNFRLSVHRKNEERTRKISPQLIVSVRLDSVSLMTSSSGVLPRRSSRDHSSVLSVVRKCSFVVSIQRDAISVPFLRNVIEWHLLRLLEFCASDCLSPILSQLVSE